MVSSKPEELVLKLYEEGMSDKEIKQQLEDFGLSGKEIHDLMKKASKMKGQEKEESGESWIEDAKEKAQKLPNPKGRSEGKSWLSGFFKKGSEPKGGKQETRGPERDHRMMKLEKLKGAISNEQKETAVKAEEKEVEVEDRPRKAMPTEEIEEIVEEQVGTKEGDKMSTTAESPSKMEQEALENLCQRLDGLESKLDGMKDLLEVIRDLDIKMVELMNRGK